MARINHKISNVGVGYKLTSQTDVTLQPIDQNSNIAVNIF